MTKPWAGKLRSLLGSSDPLWKLTTKEESVKVRCKGIWAGNDWTVLEESPNYYIAKCAAASSTASLPKADYAPVQEWVDVFTSPAIYGEYRAEVLQDGRVHLQGRKA